MRYGPGFVNGIVVAIVPSAAIGGGTRTSDGRSRRTKITWTPVCGPDPRLNDVSGFPFGCLITNETFVGLPAVTGPVGLKSTIRYVRAAGTDGKLDVDDPPQPASRNTAAAARSERLIGLLSRTGSWDAVRRSRRPRSRSARASST